VAPGAGLEPALNALTVRLLASLDTQEQLGPDGEIRTRVGLFPRQVGDRYPTSGKSNCQRNEWGGRRCLNPLGLFHRQPLYRISYGHTWRTSNRIVRCMRPKLWSGQGHSKSHGWFGRPVLSLLSYARVNNETWYPLTELNSCFLSQNQGSCH
jgi:hypothetical protein